ncbi:MAG: hypothetical protein QOE54_1857 [Streptosporangiaceae bacterium]|nr:hypothetical protein [Streptosporangiaceae bacterium]
MTASTAPATTSSTVSSADGTRIAFTGSARGPP